MKKILITLIFCVLASITTFAQTTISGQVTDKDGGDPVIGVNIIVKGKVVGTTTDVEGKFTFSTNLPIPFTLLFSSVGYGSKEIEITKNGQEIKLEMSEEVTFGQEVVISASRVEEKILESPVTIEKMDIIAIQQTSTHDFYDGIGKLKGVHTNQGSLTFTTINTRGFSTLTNTRFVQLIDGMDNSLPLLGFPMGNVIGLSELDAESVELVPGASSALYGPNAFNGILFMNSKSPFEYQGLSVQLKGGATNSDAGGSNGYTNASIRYAKAFNDKFAFKVNFSYLNATDWKANDYTTDKNIVSNQPDTNDFDGLNVYGDENQIVIPMGAFAGNPTFIDAFAPFFGGDRGLTAQTIAGLPTMIARRTGFNEGDLLDNNDAKSIKASVGLFYRINDNLELSYNYNYGYGSTIFQGPDRFALRNFKVDFHKIELKSSNFFVRAYTSHTDDGDSYTLAALGAYLNESIMPTGSWIPVYAGAYTGALLGGADLATAQSTARTAADATRPLVGSPEFNTAVAKIRTGLLGQGGAGFVDDSKLFHTEFNYNFGHLTDIVEVQIGGNYRKYDLFSANTVLNEDPEGTGSSERIGIDEIGLYTQVSKKLANDRLKLTASIRYDKNENFDGQTTPRASMVYSAGENKEHNFRASFQTGFRNPSARAQFIYLTTTTIALGGTKANAERYGIHNGGAWTNPSYQQYIGSVRGGMEDPSLLKTIDFDYIQPEQLTAYEIGYKGLIGGKLLLDVNYYYNKYKNFITVINVVSKEASEYVPKGTVFRPYLNVKEDITSTGLGIGMSYKLVKGFVLGGNYSYANFKLDTETDFEPAFNTPKDRFNLSLSNREVVKNLGFNIGFKWQDEFFWENSFGSSMMPAYSSLDAQLSYKVKSIKTIFKLGGSNIGGKQYRSSKGAPFIGSLYYLSINFDQFLN
jgi:outer membrane receptor protein involved in Fe transport